MSLIDTNVLMEWVKNWQKMDHYYLPYEKHNDIPISELEDIIERMPAAESIPTEWIENIIAEIGDDSPYRPAIKWLLLTYKMEEED